MRDYVGIASKNHIRLWIKGFKLESAIEPLNTALEDSAGKGG